jgi:hypothetical protein
MSTPPYVLDDRVPGATFRTGTLTVDAAAQLRTTTSNQRGEPVLIMTSTQLVLRRPGAPNVSRS